MNRRYRYLSSVDYECSYPRSATRPFLNTRRLPAQFACQQKKGFNSNQNIIAIDSWVELIDQPDGVFVVPTGNNCVARLTLNLVAYQRLLQTSTTFVVTVCPSGVCWTCIQQSFIRHVFIFLAIDERRGVLGDRINHCKAIHARISLRKKAANGGGFGFLDVNYASYGCDKNFTAQYVRLLC